MGNAHHDGNGAATLLAVENDGKTLIAIKGNPSTHALQAQDGATGVDNGPVADRHDESHVHVLLATSSADGITPVVVYADSSGNLLVDSA